MKLSELNNRVIISRNKTLIFQYEQFATIIQELSTRKLPDEVLAKINISIETINTFEGTDNALKKQIAKDLNAITKLLEKELKLVTKNHYRNMWLAVGMAAFGIPLGAALGLLSKNMALFSAGLPIGLGIGIVIGTHMDKKAAEEGRQLNVELKL